MTMMILKNDITKAVDKLSNGKDEEFVYVLSESGQIKIGYTAGFWKEILFRLFEVDDEEK